MPFKADMSGWLFLLLTVVGLTLSPATTAWGDETGFIRVMDLTMRSGPGTTSRPIKTLERGALVSVLGRKNGWLKIRHDAHTGYILNKTEYVRLIEADGDRTSEGPASQRREAIAARIKTSTAALTALQEEAIALLDRVDRAERETNQKRVQVLATEADLGDLEVRIQAQQTQLTELEAQLEADSEYAGRRVRALHQLHILGTLPVLANAASWLDFLKRKAALGMLLAADREALDALAADRRRHTDLLALLHSRRDEHRRLEKKLRQELAVLGDRLAERTAMLAEIQGKVSLQSDLIKGLEASAKALDTTISRLTAGVPAATAGVPAAVAAAPAAPAGERETAAADSAQVSTTPADNGSPPFKKLKGLLNLPVSGKIISSYGHYRNADFNVMNFRSGVLIQADRGEPIHAVANGTTLFADWFKGYGNMLIIDHGDHYYTVYAHLEALFKARGESVDADEVIATVGDTATLAGPGLHFEVRHHGKPMDPLPWLRKRDRAASDRKKGVDG